MSKVTKDDKNKKAPVEETFPEETGTGKFIYPNGAIYIGDYKQLSTGVRVREGKGKMIHPLIDARLDPALNPPPKSDKISRKDSQNEEKENEESEEEKEEEKKEEEKKEEEEKEKEPEPPKTNIDLTKPFPIGTSWYDGEWKDDKMEGYGIYHYSNGDIYEGNWVNNKHHGQGTYKFTDGHRYVGEWKEHKMFGSGKYLDTEDVGWSGEFRNGSYHTKEQSSLNEEKRILDKIESMKKIPDEFYKVWDKTLTGSDKTNIKDNMSVFFAKPEIMGKYVNENYPKFEEKAPDKWNEALKFVFCPQSKPAAKGSKDEIKTEVKVNVPKNGEDLIFMNKESLLVPQIQEDLNSGQVIEIEAWLEPRKVQLGIAYLKEINQWVIVFFSDQSIKGGK